jgi:hypothetical protein
MRCVGIPRGKWSLADVILLEKHIMAKIYRINVFDSGLVAVQAAGRVIVFCFSAIPSAGVRQAGKQNGRT